MFKGCEKKERMMSSYLGVSIGKVSSYLLQGRVTEVTVLDIIRFGIRIKLVGQAADQRFAILKSIQAVVTRLRGKMPRQMLFLEARVCREFPVI